MKSSKQTVFAVLLMLACAQVSQGCFSVAGTGGTAFTSVTNYDDKLTLPTVYKENAYVTTAKLCSGTISGVQWVVGWQYTLSDGTVLPYQGVASSATTSFTCVDRVFNSKINQVTVYLKRDTVQATNNIVFARFKTTSGTNYDSLGNILNSDAGSKVVALSVFVGSKAEVGTKINVWGFYNYDATICTCLNTVLFAITSVIPNQVVSLTSGIGATYTLPYFEDEVSSIKNTQNYCGKKSYVLTLSTGATPGFASVVDDVLTVQSADTKFVGEHVVTIQVGLASYTSIATQSLSFTALLVTIGFQTNTKTSFTYDVGDVESSFNPICTTQPSELTVVYSLLVKMPALPGYFTMEVDWQSSLQAVGDGTLLSDTSGFDNSESPVVYIYTEDPIFDKSTVFFDVSCSIKEYPDLQSQSLTFYALIEYIPEPDDPTHPVIDPTQPAHNQTDHTADSPIFDPGFHVVDGDGPYLEFAWANDELRHTGGLLKNGTFTMLATVNETITWSFTYADDSFEYVVAKVELGKAKLVINSTIDQRTRTVRLEMFSPFPLELKGSYLIFVYLTNTEGQETEYNLTLKLWVEPDEVDIPPPFFPKTIDDDLPVLTTVSVSMLGECSLTFANTTGKAQIQQIADLVTWTFGEFEEVKVLSVGDNSIQCQLTFFEEQPELIPVNVTGRYWFKPIFSGSVSIPPQISKSSAMKLRVLAIVLGSLMVATITAVFVTNIFVFRRGECKDLWQSFELWQLFVYLHSCGTTIAPRSVYFARYLVPAVQLDLLPMKTFALIYQKTTFFRNFVPEFQSGFVSLNIMNYSSQPDSLFLNLQASPIVAVLSLVFFLFVASVGNLQKKLRLDLSDSFYVLLKSILLLPWGLSLLLQLSRTEFTFKNLQTIFAVLLLIPFFFVIPVWASVRADRRNHRSLASRHWLSMFTRVTVTLTLGLLSKYPFWQLFVLGVVLWVKNFCLLTISRPYQTGRKAASVIEMVAAPLLLICFAFDEKGFFSIAITSVVILFTVCKIWVDQVLRKYRALSKPKNQVVPEPIEPKISNDTTTGELFTENQLMQTLKNLTLGHGQNELIIELDGEVVDNYRFDGSIQDIQFKNNDKQLEISYGNNNLADRLGRALGSNFKTQLGQVLKIPLTGEDSEESMEVTIDIELPEQPQEHQLSAIDKTAPSSIRTNNKTAKTGLRDFTLRKHVSRNYNFNKEYALSDSEALNNLTTKQFLQNQETTQSFLGNTQLLQTTQDHIQKGSGDLSLDKEIDEAFKDYQFNSRLREVNQSSVRETNNIFTPADEKLMDSIFSSKNPSFRVENKMTAIDEVKSNGFGEPQQEDGEAVFMDEPSRRTSFGL